MIRPWREPLVHFLLGGAVLFLLYSTVSEERSVRRDRIVVGEERVASLATIFQRTWFRPPTRAELEGLVQEFVDEEILYREALELGLDRDDLVVRRRLRQKMEFLHLDLVEPPASTDGELEAFLGANGDRFREPAQLGFRQVFVSPGPEGESDVRLRAEQKLARLRASGSGDEVTGDRTLLPQRMQGASEPDVAAAFGPRFARDLFTLSGEGWLGPVASSFGLHLVRIEGRKPGRLPPLPEIREQVERELVAERRDQANRRFLETLRARYQVEIRMPEPGR
ncbi:MAG: peptidylprolyl isomerase [Myxococcota bacterium]